MGPFRGRGGSRGGARGRSRGGSRRGGSDKLNRSGIRTRGGYKKFDSQRVRNVDDSDEEVSRMVQDQEEEEDEDLPDDEDISEEEEFDAKPSVKAYQQLMKSLKPADDGERKAKRRKIEEVVEEKAMEGEEEEEDEEDEGDEDNEDEDEDEDEGEGEGEGDEDEDEGEGEDDGKDDQDDDQNDGNDPYQLHFATDENQLSRRLAALKSGQWKKTCQRILGTTLCSMTFTAPPDSTPPKPITSITQLPLKDKLSKNLPRLQLPLPLRLPLRLQTHLDQTLTAHIFAYTSLLTTAAAASTTPSASLRPTLALHAVNHILKGRDKVLKNTSRLRVNPDSNLEFRDQGFTRPKVLILTETRQAAHAYATLITDIFSPDQQENRKRFDESFTAPIDPNTTMPEDYRELFQGNNDNSFLTALKFTRKTLKFYSAFYASDIILASPLGLRRIIHHEDVKKRDYDFLSSIEIVIADQLSASYMQSWENISTVFSHLNLQLKESHGCDFSRVRNSYLDGNSSSLRQTILLTQFITPEIQSLYNSLTNTAGRVKFSPIYPGTPLTLTSDLSIKQTFSRFPSTNPTTSPSERFKFFTTAILPSLLRLARPRDDIPGILIFIPSYYDFLRLRNFFATSDVTSHIAFGAIHDYSDISSQRRARSHFATGRHAILLYTERAHHFYRLRIRGVKKVVCYGLPENERFYEELVAGFLASSLESGLVAGPQEVGVRNVFCKWDGLKLERVVGTERVKGLIGGRGDTFEFL